MIVGCTVLNPQVQGQDISAHTFVVAQRKNIVERQERERGLVLVTAALSLRATRE